MHDLVRIARKLLAAGGRNVMGSITHVSTRDPVAALTFDDGPHPEFTPRLLDILERHQARATFFMVGLAARNYHELVRRVAQARHAIGNHSWDHPSFPLITGRERREQLRACAKAIAPYGKRLFRPPYGHQCVASRLDALWLNHQVIAWNQDAYDWLDHSADWMADRLVRQLQPGSVILLHDALYTAIDSRYMNREPTLKAVDMFLQHFSGRFRFITVPELFLHGRPQRQNWFRKGDRGFLNALRGQHGEARRYP